MPTIVTPRYGTVRVPPAVRDLQSFRDWVHFAELPEKLPVHFLRGDVWLDCDRSEPLVNVLLRGELVAVLTERARVRGGLFASAGMLWSNDHAGFATLPDGFFLSRDALSAGRARFSNGGNAAAKATEVVGTPDVVVEIVSATSEEKDTDWLRADYHRAGVPEYWLIDARPPVPQFELLLHRRDDYRAARATNGWVRSPTFGSSFRLTRTTVADHYPAFALEHR